MLQAAFRCVAGYLARRSLPRYEGSIRVRGLRHEVRIGFDAARIPHLIAESTTDLFFAQGWLHAMERLWQMDMFRRVCSGRMAETFGNRRLDWHDFTVHLRDRRLVDVDYFMRLLGIREAAEESAARLADEEATLITAYCAGINAFIESRQRRQLPVEFRLLSLQPEPFTAADVYTVAKGMAYQLSFSWRAILIQHGLSALPAALAEDLLPEGYGPQEPTIARVRELLALDGAVREYAGWRGLSQGSNSWVLSGARTESGHPLLANDPHLRLRAPATWYLLHLQGPGWDVEGASLPGMPGVVIGRNRHIAWGLTNAMAHDADLFQEELRGDQVRYGEGWEPLRLEPLRIGVRHGPAVHRVRRVSRHGPLISDALPMEPALAYQWTGHQTGGEVRALLGVSRASGWTAFSDALRDFVAPCQNFVYADVEGNIGYRMAGRIPRRRQGQGQRPRPGWSAEHDWEGTVPYEENPWLLNPESGYIGTANNQIVDAGYPHFISNLWEPSWRVRRIHELVATREKHDASGMMAMQMDVVTVDGRDFTADVLHPFARSDAAAALSRQAAPGLQQLLKWDGECRVGSAPAALYHVLLHTLLKLVFEPHLGETLWLAYTEQLNDAQVRLHALMRQAESPWFGDRGRDAVLAEALETSVAWLRGRRWGELHQATLQHSMGGSRTPGGFFNVGPEPTPGSIGTLNNGQFYYAFPYRHYVGASYRQVVDLAPGARSWFVLPGGQSGNPVSAHYRDQLPAWQHGNYLEMAGAAVSTLRLEPHS
ncbi:MAG: penicillin acylase family protein [Candidatus Xenobia bacterium]